jgi:hypothetical protein
MALPRVAPKTVSVAVASLSMVSDSITPVSSPFLFVTTHAPREVVGKAVAAVSMFPKQVPNTAHCAGVGNLAELSVELPGRLSWSARV